MNLLSSAIIRPAELRAMLIPMIEAKTGMKVKSLRFDVSHQMVGYGMSEYEEAVFNGVSVEFLPNSAPDSAA